MEILQRLESLRFWTDSLLCPRFHIWEGWTLQLLKLGSLQSQDNSTTLIGAWSVQQRHQKEQVVDLWRTLLWWHLLVSDQVQPKSNTFWKNGVSRSSVLLTSNKLDTASVSKYSSMEGGLELTTTEMTSWATSKKWEEDSIFQKKFQSSEISPTRKWGSSVTQAEFKDLSLSLIQVKLFWKRSTLSGFRAERKTTWISMTLWNKD